MKIIFLTLLLVFVSCAVRNSSSAFYKIKIGMTHEEALDLPGQTILDELQISSNTVIYKYDEGFTVEEKGVVKEGYEYKTIEAGTTINSLVAYGMGIVDVMKAAGWPLKIVTKGDAHVFYYRTGTLLIKENELVNTFNRNEDYRVSINAYKGNLIKNPIYYLVPSVNGLDRSSLEFIEVKNYVEHLISLSGGKSTDKLLEANCILFVNFGVGDKQVDILSYSTPIYRSLYRPGHTTTTNVQNQYGQNIGTINTTTPGSFTQQYVGQSTSQYKIESFRRHLILEAVDASSFKANQERKYFWKTTTESEGSSGDFRAILPVLAYATNGYFYKNTGKAALVRIDYDQMMNFFLEIFSR